jgi:hypothetical protein
VTAQSDRHLQQCERIALRVREKTLSDPRRQHGEAVVHQRGGSVVGERQHLELWQATALEEADLVRPERDEKPDPTARQPSGDESQDLGADAIQPRHVIHDHQQRPVRRRFREQSKYRVRHSQLARRHPVVEPNRDLQRPAVPVAQPTKILAERMDHLVKPRETHARLELDTGGPHHPGTCRRRSCRGDIEKHRLADASIPSQQQTPATDRSGRDERVKLLKL